MGVCAQGFGASVTHMPLAVCFRCICAQVRGGVSKRPDCLHIRKGKDSHTCHWLCAFVASVHRCEVGSAKDQTVCISVRAKIRLKTTEQDIRVKDWVHSTLNLMSI